MKNNNPDFDRSDTNKQLNEEPQVEGNSVIELESNEPISTRKKLLSDDKDGTLWRNMLIQIPPVVVAVLLAFIINNIWSTYQDRKDVQESLKRINSELKYNMRLYERMIDLDSTNLNALKAQIVDLEQNGYDGTFEYGEATNRFILNEGAWQAASYSGSISNFESEKIEKLSNIYTLIHFRNLAHSSVLPPSYDLYREESLLPYLRENEVVLEDHLMGLRYEHSFIEEYVEYQGR